MSYHIERLSKSCEKYTEIKNFATSAYEKVYASKATISPYNFIALKDEIQNKWDACFGISYAAKSKLFSEQYLERPCEEIIEEMIGKQVDREYIVECGSFASEKAGAGKELLKYLPVILWSEGIEYALVTVTPVVIKLFKNLKFQFKEISSIDEKYISDDLKKAWGSYYEQGPITGIIFIEETIKNNSIQNKHNIKYLINKIKINSK